MRAAPETDWRVVASGLEAYAAGPTEAQQRLVELLGVEVDPGLPQPVVAALLRRHLRTPLDLKGTWAATEGELEYLKSLADETQTAVVGDTDDRDILDAWVSVMHAKRARDHLARLQPAPGDVVAVARAGETRLGEISSISADGRLNFRGGQGAGGRPHNCEIVSRCGEENHTEVAYRARQEAAARVTSPENVGPGRLAELDRWRVEGAPTYTALRALEDALTSAESERPMQVVLEQHPEVLAHLVVGHHGTHVVPQERLGGQYVPDFLVAGQTSLGVRWTLIELESPTAPLHIQDGQASAQLRRAIQQIVDWREWLAVNVDYARRSATDNGLGLAGIRTDAQGLIIIGRGVVSDVPDPLRHRLSTEQRIEVRTYDWLLRAAALRSSHPYGLLDYELMDVAEDEL